MGGRPSGHSRTQSDPTPDAPRVPWLLVRGRCSRAFQAIRIFDGKQFEHEFAVEMRLFGLTHVSQSALSLIFSTSILVMPPPNRSADMMVAVGMPVNAAAITDACGKLYNRLQAPSLCAQFHPLRRRPSAATSPTAGHLQLGAPARCRERPICFQERIFATASGAIGRP
jgi:hypothetical protein